MKPDPRRFPVIAAALLMSALLPPLCLRAATSSSVNGHPSGQEKSAAVAAVVAAAVPREKREQAYAKLLEGQRYLIGGGVAEMSLLTAAQQAFEQAIKLDPMLSEAYVGLAHIAFFYRSDFNEAERQAMAAIRVNQDSFGAHRVLSRVLTFKSGLRESSLDKEAWERAIAELREVVRLNAADAEGWALLGDFYLGLGRRQEAITAFTNWESSPAPLDAGVYQLITRRDLTAEAAAARLSEAYLRADRPAEAYNAIRRAMSRNTDNEEYLGQLYDAVMAGGADDASALVELRRFATASPENATAQRMLALVEGRAGQTNEAVATLEQAIARRAGGPAAVVELRKDLAQTLSNATRYAEAITVYQELAKELGEKGSASVAAGEGRREAIEILTNLIGLQKQIGRATDALQTVELTRRLLGGDDPTADEQYVELLRDQSKWREALQAAREASVKYPGQRSLLWYQAATLTDLGRIDEAVALLRGQLKNTPEDVRSYIQISALYTQANRGAEAVEAARKALEQTPAANQKLQTIVLLSLSSAQEKAGDPRGSEESLRRVLAKEPNNAQALNNLGYFLIERNERLEEATGMIQRAVRAEPFNSSYLDSLGWAYYKLGKLEEAERYVSDAARRSANSVAIQEHLGDILLKRGKLAEARLAWQKALELSVEAAETARLRAKLNTNKK